jgi:hypothetical protein
MTFSARIFVDLLVLRLWAFDGRLLEVVFAGRVTGLVRGVAVLVCFLDALLLAWIPGHFEVKYTRIRVFRSKQKTVEERTLPKSLACSTVWDMRKIIQVTVTKETQLGVKRKGKRETIIDVEQFLEEAEQ